MGQLRLDPGFVSHPKLVQLSDREFRTWMRVLCWCATYNTRGVLPHRAKDELVGVTPAFLRRVRHLNLLENHPKSPQNSLGIVHDWDLYNGSIEERVSNYLEDNPQASANEVFRMVGGKRGLVQALVARYRNGTQAGTLAGTRGGTQPGPERDPNRDHTLSLSLTLEEQGLEQGQTTSSANGPEPRTPDDDELAQKLRTLGWTTNLIQQALKDPLRAKAWIDHAQTHAHTNPGAYARTGFHSGQWPKEEKTVTNDNGPTRNPKRPTYEVMKDFIRNAQGDYTTPTINEEIALQERRRNQTLTHDQRTELLQLADQLCPTRNT